ncbi:MAG: porin [Hyphomicrobiales bacterium]
MKKSILLGSAAALVAVTGAQAADLPIIEPVDYVKVCDAFGSGFHYIPGTETCLKFSGRVRAEIGVGDDDDDDDKDDESFLNSNFELVVNASSMTEIGMIVGQFAIEGSNEGEVELGDAWITIGENILVGRETSRFDFGGGYGIYDGRYVDEGINQFTFIMPFGNGVSMTLGLEDQRDRRGGIAAALVEDVVTNTAGPTLAPMIVAYDASSVFGFFESNYAGMEIPEIVASLRISQGWGSAQVSGALHQIRVMDYSNPGANIFATSSTSEYDDEFGFAVQAGVELNVGTMSKVKLVGGYADGAMHYIGGENFADAVVTYVNDGVDTLATSIDTQTGWYVLAAAQHGFGDGLTGSLTGSYYDYDDQAELWQVGATLEYEVVENLLVSLAGVYTSLDYDPSFGDTYSNAINDTDGPVRTDRTPADRDTWEAKLRVQRNF